MCIRKILRKIIEGKWFLLVYKTFTVICRVISSCFTGNKADYKTEIEDNGEDVEYICCNRCEQCQENFISKNPTNQKLPTNESKPLVSPSPTQKISNWIIPTHVFKYCHLDF